MLPRVLSVVVPLFIYTALVLVAWGIVRERRKLDRWCVILGISAFAASMAGRPNDHVLFFDEDIYIQIASNLSFAPVAQLTLFGASGASESSTYYKEPAGFPVLLSFAFLFTGTKERVAFIVARVLYAAAVIAVYLLGRTILKTPTQAIVAAVAFASLPAAFVYSSSSGTDVPAALFATLGVWGVVSGNGMLAAAALAMAAQTRLEMIAIAPLILLAESIPAKWKAALPALLAGEIAHLVWIFSAASSYAKAERVEAPFAMAHVLKNLTTNVVYLFNPLLFPLAATALAVFALFRRPPARNVLVAWGLLLFAVYLVFYAGSFEINPRYSIQIAAPILLLAVSASERRPVLFLILAASAIAAAHRWDVPAYVQALATDHRIAAEFAGTLGSSDLVVSSEPEVFLNYGANAMNAVFAAGRPARLAEQFGKYKRIFYYSGIRTNELDTELWRADQEVKSHFELHLVEARDILGFRISIYELLNSLDGKSR